ncbi:ABC transporter permease [Phaeovulum vinaykumarii]|uniref:Putative ABC transport system permease protein n=1 Tax=Phaeovulum vinaykumarii TaxID=407234 RepID=A0A1N7KUG8_9RHOB|nr:ABC transporter permease [Phaeovulum vinaykumarii]SIS65248.1 putative ABC transport system permease protein [Phaeovulum vinaykumarii]SOC01351.1 putative ABC transport system permease protein [Phaeovulum vinaykumarii]
MSPLDRKLLRDLARMRGQALAIAAVIAMGVLLQVMMSGLVTSLSETRRAYYERNRMADVVAPLTRAPDAVLERLAAIPGVAGAEGRIDGAALLDMPGHDVPVQAQALSLPDRGPQRLMLLHLTAGQLPPTAARDAVVVLDAFARAHGLRLGDRIAATMNGARMDLKIVGLAQSPEHLYVAVPGEMSPDPARFGVFWMRRTALAAAYDMDGAFNAALFALSRDARLAEVLDRIDRVLAPYGGTGAMARDTLVSDRFVSEEIESLGTMNRVVPPLFLAVAAFLLNIVAARLVEAEREEIGLLKAFGYRGREIGAHYMKLVLVIAVLGALAGCLLGVAAGRGMVRVYAQFYHFPFLIFRPDPGAFVTGVLTSIGAASAGGVFVLRRVFRLAPAEAMRPPAPADYSRARPLSGALGRLLDQPTRMVLRRVIRAPLRMAALSAGIAGGMALAAGMTTIYGGFDRMITLSFTLLDRSDATVIFTHPLSEKAALEMGRMAGVIRVEPFREVPAILRNGAHTHRGSLSGIAPDAGLVRPIGADMAPIVLPERGVVVSQTLAEILHLAPGDRLIAEIREGAQPRLALPVAQVAQSLMGAPAYMRLDALGRAVDAPGQVSGVHLRLDPAAAPALYRRLKAMPQVAGVSVATDARRALRELMDTGAGATRFVLGAVAFVITFGIIYNAARIGHAERARDLAALRVMGFTKAETAFVLLGELALITLAALPAGAALGHGLSIAIARGFSTELYRIPTGFDPAAQGMAALYVLIAALVSGALVARDLARTDPITVLKTRE